MCLLDTGVRHFFKVESHSIDKNEQLFSLLCSSLPSYDHKMYDVVYEYEYVLVDLFLRSMLHFPDITNAYFYELFVPDTGGWHGT